MKKMLILTIFTIKNMKLYIIHNDSIIFDKTYNPHGLYDMRSRISKFISN